MASLVLKRGDTSPPLEAQLLDADGNPANLSGAIRIRFIMVDKQGNVVVDANASPAFPTEGIVRFFWRPGDTAVAGTFQAEFEVTFNDGSICTYPNDRYLIIQIIPDLA